jgi:hypothetical protein
LRRADVALRHITDDLADTVSKHRASARDIWLANESQFLGNQATRALYADADFRTFSQGELSITEYCRLYKRKAQDLRDSASRSLTTLSSSTSFAASMNDSKPSGFIFAAPILCLAS